MGTRITYRRVLLEEGGHVDIQHVQNGWIQVFDADQASPVSGRDGNTHSSFVLQIAVVEPISDVEPGSSGSE